MSTVAKQNRFIISDTFIKSSWDNSCDLPLEDFLMEHLPELVIPMVLRAAHNTSILNTQRCVCGPSHSLDPRNTLSHIAVYLLITFGGQLRSKFSSGKSEVSIMAKSTSCGLRV